MEYVVVIRSALFGEETWDIFSTREDAEKAISENSPNTDGNCTWHIIECPQGEWWK